MAFDYTSGNPDNLVGGGPARMQDIQGPFYDIRAYLNSAAGGGGSGLPALTDVPILEVGMAGQLRAGRQLRNEDFTDLGLAVPLALWNLNDLTDVSGNGRVLVNKGAVTFAEGINGIAASAARFAGTTAQALYVADTGAGDSLRIKTGTIGCWVRTAKRALVQYVLAKGMGTGNQRAYRIAVDSSNAATCYVSFDGTLSTGISTIGTSDVADDRWHFIVMTFDGAALRLYVDGALENVALGTGLIFGGSAALNIGITDADAVAAGSNPHFGRVDEAFVTADVLSEDQVRCLYAAKVTHTLAAQPSGITLNVRRRRRGAVLAQADFPSAPLRLYNLRGTGATFLSDDGAQGAALAVVGGSESVAGPDGSPQSASHHGGSVGNLSATDAGLPAGAASRSYGCWFKTSGTGAGGNMLAWGTSSTGDTRVMVQSGGALSSFNGADGMAGPVVTDGYWHHAVVVEENAPVDGVKRKLYLDGRLVGSSLVLNAIVLAGATSFRIGANSAGAGIWTGQLARAFVMDTALTSAQIAALYVKGGPSLGASPKNVGDHVERFDDTEILFVGDTLESQSTIDLGVLS